MPRGCVLLSPSCSCQNAPRACCALHSSVVLIAFESCADSEVLIVLCSYHTTACHSECVGVCVGVWCFRVLTRLVHQRQSCWRTCSCTARMLPPLKTRLRDKERVCQVLQGSHATPLSLSLSLSHTHTHTHTEVLIHCPCFCSLVR
jgi:hypothetical protein